MNYPISVEKSIQEGLRIMSVSDLAGLLFQVTYNPISKRITAFQPAYSDEYGSIEESFNDNAPADFVLMLFDCVGLQARDAFWLTDNTAC